MKVKPKETNIVDVDDDLVEVNAKLQHEFNSWLNNFRERRAGRLQYGLLG